VLGLLASVSLPAVSAEVPLKGHEAAGQAAEEAGRFEEAFDEYLQALRALPEPPLAAADARLRERIISVVPRLGAPPTVSEEAEQHYMKAQALVEAQEVLGTAADVGALQAAAAGFRKAIRAAPWWPDPLIALAKLQQRLKRYDEAADNLRLYRLAQPAPATTAAVEHPAAAPNPEVATAAKI
jgi:tetratricopeptide (TPR) repeat protein